VAGLALASCRVDYRRPALESGIESSQPGLDASVLVVDGDGGVRVPEGEPAVVGLDGMPAEGARLELPLALNFGSLARRQRFSELRPILHE
jgi:hypothetical protein